MATSTPAGDFGSIAPDFDLPGTDGRRHTRDGTRGPFGLLVMFICNHCPYVKAIQDRLVLDAHEISGAGIGVIAISSNDAVAYPEDSFENMQRLARELEFKFPYAYDESQQVARAYGAVCTPDFFGYDRDLKLRYRGRLDEAGRNPRTFDTKRDLVAAMLEIATTGDTRVPQVPSIGCSIKYR